MRWSYFPSGSNRPGEIRGWGDVGQNVGVSALELGESAMEELLAFEGTGRRVFVDSGAFAEVSVDEDGALQVTRPMDEAAWAAVMSVYRRLGERLGGQLVVVAPDRVGDQDVSLERLERWRGEIAHLVAGGVRVVVPIQKGRRSMAEFDEAACEALGWSGFIRGIPLNKDATSAPCLATFLAEARPCELHLLGLGPTSPRFPVIKGLIERCGCVTSVTMDSGRLRALIGRGRGVRPFTRALDEARDALAEGMWGGFGRGESMDPIDYTDAIGEPESWLTGVARLRVIRGLKAEGFVGLSGGVDLDAWVQDGDRYLDPRVEAVLNEEWRRHFEATTANERKRRAIGRLTPEQRGAVPALFKRTDQLDLWG